MASERYRLLERIGQGGMATVWRADDAALGRQVAVKLLLPFVAERPDSVERFEREARALAGIRHPNILQLFDYLPGAGEEPPRLIMELLAGPSLHRFVADAGTPLPEVAALIGAEVAAGLGAVHARGIVHRDVKPENVLLDAGRIVLTDFGIARVALAERSALTQTGAIIGSPAYMSPEQARGDEVDARSDLFSLGSLMYFLATGSAPFSGPHPLVVMQKIDRGDFAPAGVKNPRVPAWLERIIRRCLTVDVSARYPDAAAVDAALRAGLAADGLADPAAELQRYFADPPAYNAALPTRIVPIRFADAERAMASGDRSRAMASVERVLQLDPHHVAARALFARVVRRVERAKYLGALAAALIVIAAVTPFAWAHFHRVPTTAPVIAASVAPPTPTPTPTPTTIVAPKIDPIADHARPRATRPAHAETAPIAVLTLAPVLEKKNEPKPEPEPGSLEVRTSPWCDLEIDGRSLGRTPQKTSLPAGHHAVRCTNPSGALLERGVEITAGQPSVLEEHLLMPVALRPTLTRGDAFAIDASAATKTATSVAAGRHRIRLLKEGRTLESRWLDISPDGCHLLDQPELHCDGP